MAQETDDRTEEELRREGAERALKANQARNADRLARMEQIADSAETTGEHADDVEVTDEMYQDLELPENVRAARAIVKAQVRAEDDGEDHDEQSDDEDEPANDVGAEDEADEARDAGADDVRMVNGQKQYRLVVNGKAMWKTLDQIRATAQKVEAADEYLQVATEAARKATRVEPSAEEAQARTRASEERKAHIRSLLARQAMGDEQAIDELAGLLDSAPSVVTPDVLKALDERFDSRVTFREAVDWFESQYEQELKHPAMKSYAGELDAALALQNPGMSPKQRLKRVGDQIRKELGDTYGLGSRKGPSDKAQRKSEIRRPQVAAGRQRAAEDEGEDEDVSSVINGMARGRHQPRAVVHGPIRNR